MKALIQDEKSPRGETLITRQKLESDFLSSRIRFGFVRLSHLPALCRKKEIIQEMTKS